jgi:hypothetical protein
MSAVSDCSRASSLLEGQCTATSQVWCIMLSADSSMFSVIAPTCPRVWEQPSPLVRSKQGALGLPRRAEHPTSICMPSATVSDCCARVVSVRRAFSSDILKPRELDLLAKNRPISHGGSGMIGEDTTERKRGLTDPSPAVHPLLSAFDKGESQEAQCGEETVACKSL